MHRRGRTSPSRWSDATSCRTLIALNSSLFNTARIFGPALAGVLIAAVGAGWCFAINSVSFLAVLASLLAMRVSELYPAPRPQTADALAWHP